MAPRSGGFLVSAARTARSQGMAGCHACGLLVQLSSDSAGGATCPRCRASLHSRKVDSVRRCWAFLLAAAVLYIPANVLPIMPTESLGFTQPDTIMRGILFLLEDEWPLALVVFVASVVVPLLKLVVLSYLLYSVQSGSRWRAVDRTRLYRIAEAIGRWSMVDIYVVSILVALVRLDQLASVDAEVGVVFFGAVVVLTIFAAQSFDPRLIWDRMEEGNG